jgi:hypothetical protein
MFYNFSKAINVNRMIISFTYKQMTLKSFGVVDYDLKESIKKAEPFLALLSSYMVRTMSIKSLAVALPKI